MARVPIAPGMIGWLNSAAGQDWIWASLQAPPSVNLGEGHISFFGADGGAGDAALFVSRWEAGASIAGEI